MNAQLPQVFGQVRPRFSGHETFVCRYAWLPKAYRGLLRNPTLFANETLAMTELGLGKNMVRSLRFWIEVAGVATSEGAGRMVPTAFGHDIFRDGGHDPFLEDVRTLWLLHWKLSTRDEAPLFAWNFLLNRWPNTEFTRSEALAAFSVESRKLGYSHSEVTLAQHLDVFTHTYQPTRSTAVGVEDSLDGPLTELGLLQPVGERKNAKGRWETAFGFRRDAKPDISPALFEWCLQDYWCRFFPSDEVLTHRQIAVGEASPGQVFKLTEDDVRSRLERYGSQQSLAFAYRPSAVQGLLSRSDGIAPATLADVYRKDPHHV